MSEKDAPAPSYAFSGFGETGFTPAKPKPEADLTDKSQAEEPQTTEPKSKK